jgi:hypothetical protein
MVSLKSGDAYRRRIVNLWSTLDAISRCVTEFMVRLHWAEAHGSGMHPDIQGNQVMRRFGQYLHQQVAHPKTVWIAGLAAAAAVHGACRPAPASPRWAVRPLRRRPCVRPDLHSMAFSQGPAPLAIAAQWRNCPARRARGSRCSAACRRLIPRPPPRSQRAARSSHPVLPHSLAHPPVRPHFRAPARTHSLTLCRSRAPMAHTLASTPHARPSFALARALPPSLLPSLLSD